VRCPILIGRQEPAALTDGMLGRLARPSRGSALIVAGEAGIGKSRLAEHMSLLAARAGVRVVTGRAMPAGAGGPLGPVAEVIHEITRGRPVPADADLAPYLAVLASLVPHWRRPGWSAGHRQHRRRQSAGRHPLGGDAGQQRIHRASQGARRDRGHARLLRPHPGLARPEAP
jgi:hypothetical protein